MSPELCKKFVKLNRFFSPERGSSSGTFLFWYFRYSKWRFNLKKVLQNLAHNQKRKSWSMKSILSLLVFIWICSLRCLLEFCLFCFIYFCFSLYFIALGCFLGPVYVHIFPLIYEALKPHPFQLKRRTLGRAKFHLVVRFFS